MTRYVVDASVVIKWLQPERESEPNIDRALDLLLAYRRGEVDLLQPVHWIAEAAAVLARIGPAIDTLYHAVAFHVEDGQLITSDTRYFKKGRSLGRILWLGDLKLQQA